MKALITGIAGQDGSFLAEFLLNKGYRVHGIERKETVENISKLENLKNVLNQINIYPCSVDNHSEIYKIIKKVEPDECYHFAASSFVSYSFDDEHSMISTNFNSTHYLLSSLKEINPKCRFYFAASSELFGQSKTFPQNEETKFNPRSIYGISKLASFYVVKNYREHHKMYVCSGISYNHESIRRGNIFVTRKITSSVAKIVTGQLEKLELGNIDAIRDWGYAPEYVQAMWKMLNNPNGPNDYVISTGIGHTVREFLKIAFDVVGLDYKKYVVINEKFFRPSEKIPLIGDNSKIKKDLNWQPGKKFEEIVREMVEHDLILNQVQYDKKGRSNEPNNKKTKNSNSDVAST